jgi:hypothetical protein
MRYLQSEAWRLAAARGQNPLRKAFGVVGGSNPPKVIGFLEGFLIETGKLHLIFDRILKKSTRYYIIPV